MHTTTPTVRMPDLPLFGRDDELQSIQDAVADEQGSPRLIYIEGQGGTGKTRLLQEVRKLQQAYEEHARKPFLWSEIVDFYHSDLRSPLALQEAIADGLDPTTSEFPEGMHFNEFRTRVKEARREGASGKIKELRQRAEDAFWHAYSTLATSTPRLVVTLDTAELLEYEDDFTQTELGIRAPDSLAKSWLLERLERLTNTVLIIATRPRDSLRQDVEQACEESGVPFVPMLISSLTDEHWPDFVYAVDDWLDARERPTLSMELEPNPLVVDSSTMHLTPQQQLLNHSGGRPIFLIILGELAASAGSSAGHLVRTFTRDATENERYLIDYLTLQFEPPLCHAIEWLVYTRKGLNAELLSHLEYFQGRTKQYCEFILNQVAALKFVKTRQGTDLLFLHDEIYDMFERHFVAKSRKYEEIARYYRTQLNQVQSQQEREEIYKFLLYYELQVNAFEAYHFSYARWDEEAIKSHQSDLDMQMRDEVLRFLDRYLGPRSDEWGENSERVARVLSGEKLDALHRDCAVRWIKRFSARNDYPTALQNAERLYYYSNPNDLLQYSHFVWSNNDDASYKASMLTAWAEAMLLSGELPTTARDYLVGVNRLTLQEAERLAPREAVRLLLNVAIDMLHNGRQWEKHEKWWRARILGRAHNNIGYSYRMEGRYGLALGQYQHALNFFKEVDIRDEYADTLTNLAYVQGLLGRVNIAVVHIDEAIRIREDIGRNYPIALSFNTRGILFTLQDHPIWGREECEEALARCRELGSWRGMGLTHNALGFSIRFQGNQWKLGIKRYPPGKAGTYFHEAREHLLRAVAIFRPKRDDFVGRSLPADDEARTKRIEQEIQGAGAEFLPNQDNELYLVKEPIRLWEAYNELGSLYCDWAWWLHSFHHATTEALEHYQWSLACQEAALKVADAFDLLFQCLDSYDDLAQLFGDQAFLLSSISRDNEARRSLRQGEEYLQRIENEPALAAYKLSESVTTSGEGWEPGEAYWLTLGKLHLQRGIWAFRKIEYGWSPDLEHDKHVEQGLREFARALAYFEQYGAHSFAFGKTKRAFAVRLKDPMLRVSREQASEAVQSVAEEYGITLLSVIESINDILGV